MLKPTPLPDLHEEWLNDADYQQAFQTPELEIALGREITRARIRATLTQEQLAQRMGTTQPAIASLEAGESSPGIKALKKLAEVTGSHLVVKFEETPPPPQNLAS
jgi:ribosome-binding protein aMBF1 (putative translation factor)